MLPPCSTTRTAEGAPAAAAPPRAATTVRRPSTQRTMALPHLLVAAAALLGGTAHDVRRCFTSRTHIVAPRATQCESRRGIARCLAGGPGLSPGHTVYNTADLLQAASPAIADLRPADQLAARPPCSLPTSTACTNIVDQLSLAIVPSPTGPINHYIRINYQLRLRPWQGRTTYLTYLVGAAGPKLPPHTFAGFLGPTKYV